MVGDQVVVVLVHKFIRQGESSPKFKICISSLEQFASQLLPVQGKTISSYKNIDSVYNIPKSILKCNTKTKYLILEMGVEYVNDMDFYRWMVKPDIVLVLNI